MGLWSKPATAAEMNMKAEQAQMQLKMEYERQQADIARQMMNSAAMSSTACQNAYQNAIQTGIGTIGGSTAGQIFTSSNTQTQWRAPKQPRFNPNEHPATQMALSALADLWRAKYGDTWVDCMAPVEEGDTFWPAGCARLERNDKLEKYDDNQANIWLRIKEDA